MNTKNFFSTLYVYNSQIKRVAVLVTFGFLMAIGVQASALSQPAQADSDVICQGVELSLTDKGKCDEDGESAKQIEDTLDKILNWLFWVVGIASVIMLIYGGLRYVVSAGNAEGVKGARNTIIYALIGLVVAILAKAIATYVLTEVGGTNETEISN